VTGESIKTKLLATTLLVGLSGGIWAGAATAQDADAPVTVSNNADEDEAAVQKTVTVTGSRIRRPEYTSVFPTEFIGLEEIEKNGFNNIADALNATPAFGVGVDPVGNQGANIGANLTSFLGLGINRTLTVVNGRRFVAGDVGGSLAVDLNVIPNALIAGTETIGVGGAPVYGADAIAGTVNILLKEDFEGFDLRGQYGVNERGDGDNFNVEFTLGANTADGRGNVTFAFQYSDQQGFLNTARPEIFTNEPFLSDVPVTGDGSLGLTQEIDLNGDGTPDTITNLDLDGDGVADAPFRLFNATGLSGTNVQLFTNGGVASPGALFIPSLGAGSFGGNFVQFADNGDLVPLAVGTTIPGTSVFFAQGGEPFDFFDQVTNLQSPLERIAFGSTYRYDITDNIKFKGDVQIANTLSSELANQGGFQTFAFDDLTEALSIPVSNPFLNQQARDTLTGFGLGADDSFFLSRFNNDLVGAGARNSESFVWRISTGLEGEFEFADRNFYWDIYGTAGETTTETAAQPVINDLRFLNAIEAVVLTQDDVDQIALNAAGGVPDAFGVPDGVSQFAPSNGSIGEVGDIVCQVTRDFARGDVDPATIRGVLSGSGVTFDASTAADVTDCQPLNLFGEGNASAEALNFVVQNGSTQSDIDQSIFAINFGGELIDLPAGPVSFNVGYETRRERGNFQPDSGLVVGLGRGGATPVTGGSFRTNEYLAEINLPLVSPDLEIPFVHAAEVSGQLRQINSSITNDDLVWTVGGSFSPFEDLTINGNYTESARSPSVTELFSPFSTSFQFADDPCDDDFITDDLPGGEGNRATNCESIGITQPFASNVQNATVSGQAGGNPGLQNETAESFSITAVLQPRWVPGFSIKADYISIDIAGAIANVNLEDNLEACFDLAPAEFTAAQAAFDFANTASPCNAFLRDAAGQVVDFQVQIENSDVLSTEFLNIQADYTFDVADALKLSRITDGSGDWGQFGISFQAFHTIDRTSQVFERVQDNTVGGFNDPRWSGLADFTWSGHGVTAFWRTQWQDRTLFSPSGEDFFVDQNENLINDAGGRTLHTASIAYDLSQAFSNYDNPVNIQLTVNNVFDRSPNESVLDRVFGNFGNAELFGRSFQLSLRTQF